MPTRTPRYSLIPGLGIIAWGKDKSESRVTAEFEPRRRSHAGAEAHDEYVSLPQQEAFDIEYWLLEEAKLRRMPPEKELARRVVAVIGAGSGIGRNVAQRMAKEGAHIACIDVDGDAATRTTNELIQKLGVGIGVGGTGISNCGPALGLRADVTDRRHDPRDV